MSGLFGELYLRSTKPFLTERVTSLEAAYLHHQLGRRGPVLDVGCGHGRHLASLAPLRRDVVGVELDPASVAEAARVGPVVRADFFRLPFATERFWGAFAWYNTLFTFDDVQLTALLRELARVLRPGGRLIIQNTNRLAIEAHPEAAYDQRLPDGGRLVEASRFDPATGRDTLDRTLTLPDGRVLSARFFIRYFRLDELTALLQDAGLWPLWAHGGIDSGPLTATSTDLIVGAEKRG